MDVQILVNGHRIKDRRAWNQVPHVGEIVWVERSELPGLLDDCAAKVTRVEWHPRMVKLMCLTC